MPAFGVDEVAGYIGPVLVIGAFPLSFITRLTRTSLVEVQQQDYIRTARSKGISEFKVIYKHALRNALLPVVTYIGPMVASIVTGSFVIETVFGIPGVGQLFTDSIVNRAYYGVRTMLTESTTNAFLILESVDPARHDDLAAALDDLAARTKAALGGEMESHIVTKGSPAIALS